MKTEHGSLIRVESIAGDTHGGKQARPASGFQLCLGNPGGELVLQNCLDIKIKKLANTFKYDPVPDVVLITT